ncbi:rhomboid family intramembrane serine protease [Limoniibacter endophyticus]|uniref:Rhomboid family intramembrane serine protease n=1 Tax=Limoniibacter endophyticus TaxID=1565040 RepID=A0A8J3DQ98_9HYPH|nr:rhomboid family intramembrane serine protease [Limoniibacter endophyticus]GHC76263.1 rhomboid family intramembrane serine protease [Limoniibacter endophyticus]
MFIPLHDANRLQHIKLQYMTLALMGINIAIYLLTTVPGSYEMAAAISFGFIPAVVNDIADLPPGFDLIPHQLSYVTYAFLHGNLMHLAGNMLFLWVFGDNVEDAMGHVRYLVFYILCAVGGAILHGLVIPESQMPLIGASGAIAGIVTAYLVLHPRVKIWVLAFGRIPLRIPAWFVLAGWIAWQFGMFFIGGDDEISWAAHIGGIVTGGILVWLLRRRDVPLLDRRIETPRSVAIDASLPAAAIEDTSAWRGPWSKG